MVNRTTHKGHAHALSPGTNDAEDTSEPNTVAEALHQTDGERKPTEQTW